MFDMSPENTWKQVMDLLKENPATEPAVDPWLAPLMPVSLSEASFILAAQTDIARNFITTRYISHISNAARQILGHDVSIDIISMKEMPEISSEGPPFRPETPDEAAPAAILVSPAPLETVSVYIDEKTGQGALFNSGETAGEKPAPAANVPEDFSPLTIIGSGDRSSLLQNYTFDTFVTGSNNRFAHAAAKAVAESPGMAYNPFFIYGGVGLGKTHLMHAIGNQILDNYPNMRVLYITSEKFTNEFIDSIQEGRPDKFRQRYRSIDALLVDDIQFLHNKERTQEEFFHTFNALRQENKQIILSSDRKPSELKTLEDRLRSRFEWGLITDITAPDLETRIAILQKKALLDHISVPDDVLVFIATRIDKNIRELEGALTRVVAYSSINREQITTNIAQQAMNDLYDKPERPSVTIELIQEIVCRYYKVSKEDLLGKSRSRNIVIPRQVAIYLCKELTDTSLQQIGNYFGGKDHTTVMHSFNKIRDNRHKKEDLDKSIIELISQIQKM